MAISEFEPWVRINGQLQVYTTSNKNLGQTAPSAWKCPKTQFWGPLTENLNPLQGLQTLWPHHQKTHRTGQKTMYWFIMTCIELGVIGKKNSLPHWKARIWLSWLFSVVGSFFTYNTEFNACHDKSIHSFLTCSGVFWWWGQSVWRPWRGLKFSVRGPQNWVLGHFQAEGAVWPKFLLEVV